MRKLLKKVLDKSKWLVGAEVFSYVVILFGIFLLPIVFSPFWSIPVGVTKQLFLVVFVLVALVFYIISKLENKQLLISKNYLYPLLALPLVGAFFSALASSYRFGSFSGVHFDVGTVVFLAILYVLLLLVSVIVSSKEKIINVYLGLLLAGLVAGIYQLVVVLATGIAAYFGSSLSISIISLPISLIGRWYESAVFFGFIVGSALVFLEFLSVAEDKLFKKFLFITLGVSLLCLALINFYLVWVALAFWSIGVFVYTLSSNKEKETKSKSYLSIFRPSFFVLIFSIMFLTLGTSQGVLTRVVSSVYNALSIPVIEVRPDFMATWSVAKGVLANDPILGPGPNQFSNVWSLYKPQGVNISPFWQIDFNSGVGSVPSFWISTGLLGFIGWFIFLGVLAYLTWLSCLAVVKSGDRFMKIITLLSIASFWYFLIFSFVYVGESVSLGLVFIFAGLILSLAVSNKFIDFKEFSFNNKIGQVLSIIGLSIFLLGSLIGLYLALERVWGSTLFFRSLHVVNKVGNVEKAERLLARAVTHNPQADVYYRTLSNLQFIRLSQLANSTDQDPEVLQQQFRGVLQTSIANSERAIILNPTNYTNYMSLAQVYESLVPFNIEGAYERAKEEYNKARVLNPSNPSILFSIARLEMTKGNNAEARVYLDESLAKKPNFASSLLVLAQIDAQEGRLSDAVRRTEGAALMYPNDPSVFFQLGFYYYQNNENQKAIEVLRRSIDLNPGQSNLNTKYLLGLVYEKVGDRNNALKQFEEIIVFNPDNQEIKNIITNLKSGVSLNPVEEEIVNVEEE